VDMLAGLSLRTVAGFWQRHSFCGRQGGTEGLKRPKHSDAMRSARIFAKRIGASLGRVHQDLWPLVLR